MRQYNELGVDPYNAMSRVRDTNDLTENDRAIETYFMGMLGLTINREGELVRRTITMDGRAQKGKQLISYEGAVTLFDAQVRPFMSNLGSYTHLDNNQIMSLSRNFGKTLAVWLYSHRLEFNIDRRDIHSIVMNTTRIILLQLNRSKNGELITQVMGNMSKQYVYQGNLDDQQGDFAQQPARRSWWNLGGIMGGR